MAKTPVICTPFPSAFEMGVIDGVNGYVVPYDMEFDVTKLLNVPSFDFKYDNKGIIKQWREILGNTKPNHDYQPGKMVMTKVKSNYYDILLERDVTKGMELVMTEQRALQVMDAGFIEIIGGV